MVKVSEVRDQYLIGGDQTVYFSHGSDVVDASVGNELIRGQLTLMHSGSATYTGTSFDSPGWDNIVSGNRGDDWWQGNWDAPGRDLFRGGKDND